MGGAEGNLRLALGFEDQETSLSLARMVSDTNNSLDKVRGEIAVVFSCMAVEGFINTVLSVPKRVPSLQEIPFWKSVLEYANTTRYTKSK